MDDIAERVGRNIGNEQVGLVLVLQFYDENDTGRGRLIFCHQLDINIRNWRCPYTGEHLSGYWIHHSVTPESVELAGRPDEVGDERDVTGEDPIDGIFVAHSQILGK